MNSYDWYQQLIKPGWSPPAWLFGPVWTLLYAVIAATFGYAGYMFFKGRISFMVIVPFVLNIIFNLVFTPVQFGLKNNLLAAIDIILVLATLVWLIISIWPQARWIALANIPYLVWLSFATVLQISITFNNWPK